MTKLKFPLPGVDAAVKAVVPALATREPWPHITPQPTPYVAPPRTLVRAEVVRRKGDGVVLVRVHSVDVDGVAATDTVGVLEFKWHTGQHVRQLEFMAERVYLGRLVPSAQLVGTLVHHNLIAA